jgi:acetyl coenzyme A synthetase (ADP forming)-like protein
LTMLENLFSPDKVAVVGASRHKGKTGHEIFDNLIHGFEGEAYPVNPKAEEIEGEKAYDEIQEGTDLAVIAVPGKIVPDVMRQCGEKNVGAGIIISAGFSETGNDEREQKVLEIAEENDIQLLGPNVLGLINTENSMNASFASKMPEKGGISFMSQSGAFCTAILDYAKAEHIGFRHFVSLGNKAMLDEIDLLEKWRKDETDVILSYTEGIENGRDFIEEAEKTSWEKPVVMVKSGRTDEGGSAASSHTGSIAGSYEAYKAAFRKAGIIEAESNRELLNFGRAFDYQPLPEGDRVAVITNAGGPGVITADEISERGLELAELSQESRNRLENEMPEETTIHNPLDVIGDAGHERYSSALEALGEDGNVDSIIVLLTPQANTEIRKTARTIANQADSIEKPVLACFIGEKDIQKGIDILEDKGIPDFQDPKDAVKVLKQMNSYRRFLETEYTYKEIKYNSSKAEEGLANLEGYEDAEKLLSAYNFDLALTEVAEAPLPAVKAAQNVGYPVVLKIDSPDIRHKTDIGAVKTGLENKGDVRDAFNEIVNNVHIEASGSTINGVQVQEQLEGLEIALGMKRDPQFGPMVMVGLGGVYIEVFNDVSFGIAPISEQEAQQMIDELQSHEIFEGVRGEDHDLEPVKDAVIRLGELALNHEEIMEIDLNPAILRNGKLYITDIVVETG